LCVVLILEASVCIYCNCMEKSNKPHISNISFWSAQDRTSYGFEMAWLWL